MSASLLLIMVPPSVTSKTVSTRALSSIDAAAVSRCSPLLLRFLLPPSDSSATVNLNRENGQWCCQWLDDLLHSDFCTFRVLYALQETTIGRFLPRMCLVILCMVVVSASGLPVPTIVGSHERCTSILVGAVMTLSVHLPNSGFDKEEDCYATLEAVRNIMDVENCRWLAFFIGGDINILQLEPGNEDLQGIDWCGWAGMSRRRRRRDHL